MALRSGFRAQIGHLDEGPMWVNGKTVDLADKIEPLRDAPRWHTKWLGAMRGGKKMAAKCAIYMI